MENKFLKDIGKCLNESVEMNDTPVEEIKHRDYTAKIFKDKRGFYHEIYDEDGEEVYENGEVATEDLERFSNKNDCIEHAKAVIDVDNRGLGEYELEEYGSTSRLYDYDDIDQEKYEKFLDNDEHFSLSDILKESSNGGKEAKSFTCGKESIKVSKSVTGFDGDPKKALLDFCFDLDDKGFEVKDSDVEKTDSGEVVMTAEIPFYSEEGKNELKDALKKEGFECINCDSNGKPISEAVDNDKLMDDIADVLCKKLGIDKFDSMKLSDDNQKGNIRTRYFEYEAKNFDKPNDDLPLDTELANAVSLNVEGITNSDVDTFRCDEKDHYDDEGKIFQVFVTVTLDASQLEGMKKNDIFEDSDIYNLEYMEDSNSVKISIVKTIDADSCPLDSVHNVVDKLRDFENEVTDELYTDLDITATVDSFINFPVGHFVVNMEFKDLNFDEVFFLVEYFKLNGFTEGDAPTFGYGE